MSFNKKVVIDCDYGDVEKVIADHYGHNYEIMPMEEVGSSQYAATYSQDVSKGELDEYELDKLKTLIDGKPDQFILSTIMRDLCNKGLIDTGEYLIQVNW